MPPTYTTIPLPPQPYTIPTDGEILQEVTFAAPGFPVKGKKEYGLGGIQLWKIGATIPEIVEVEGRAVGPKGIRRNDYINVFKNIDSNRAAALVTTVRVLGIDAELIPAAYNRLFLITKDEWNMIVGIIVMERNEYRGSEQYRRNPKKNDKRLAQHSPWLYMGETEASITGNRERKDRMTPAPTSRQGRVMEGTRANILKRKDTQDGDTTTDERTVPIPMDLDAPMSSPSPPSPPPGQTTTTGAIRPQEYPDESDQNETSSMTAPNGNQNNATAPTGNTQSQATQTRTSLEANVKAGTKRPADSDPARTPMRDLYPGLRGRSVSSPQRLMTTTTASLAAAKAQEAEATAAANEMFSPLPSSLPPRGPTSTQLSLPDPMTIRIPRKAKDVRREARRVRQASQTSPSPASMGDTTRPTTPLSDANTSVDMADVPTPTPPEALAPAQTRIPPTVTVSPMKPTIVIHGWNRDNVLSEVPREIKDIWLKEAGGIAFVHIYDSYRINKTKEAAELLRIALSSILRTDQVRIGTPVGAADLFVCGGLSEGQKRALLSRSLWSTNLISFDPIPFEPSISSYAFSLRGVRIQDDANGEREVVKEVRKILENTTSFASYFCQVARFQLKNQRTRTMEAIRSDTLRSMTAKALRLPMSDGNTDLIWNVYMDSPSDHPGEHKRKSLSSDATAADPWTTQRQSAPSPN
ncbi:hypothetical protein H0H93_010422 [Arthromyces matolae]|nr:hypothetical protein H0H93_010422 [Arthromyces matolae]